MMITQNQFVRAKTQQMQKVQISNNNNEECKFILQKKMFMILRPQRKSVTYVYEQSVTYVTDCTKSKWEQLSFFAFKFARYVHFPPRSLPVGNRRPACSTSLHNGP